DALLEEAGKAPSRRLLHRTLEVGGDDLAARIAPGIVLDAAPERLVADDVAEQVEHTGGLVISVGIEELVGVLARDVVDDGAPAPSVGMKIAAQLLAHLGAELVLALFVLLPDIGKVGGEALLEPGVSPVAHGDEVAVPLVNQLVGNNWLGGVVETGTLVAEQTVGVGGGAGV